MIFKKGYLYQIIGTDVTDNWSSLTVLEDIRPDTYEFRELEIIWNGVREAPGELWSPGHNFMNSGCHKVTEIGLKEDFPEYFL